MRVNVPSVAPQFLRSRIGKVCVAIIGSTAAEMLEKASAVVKETPFLEFRLDYLEKPLLALPKFKQFFTDNTAATGIATCRRTANGGKCSGNVAAEIEVLSKAAAAGFHIVDVELESAEAMKKGELQNLRDTGVALIISHHDFAATKDLEGIYKRIVPFHPDFIKIVPTARVACRQRHAHALHQAHGRSLNIIGYAWATQGIISRVLGVRAGSAFTFAAPAWAKRPEARSPRVH
jgi:3-dehydroquinate dehydratase/shikimate dehydrogenase